MKLKKKIMGIQAILIAFVLVVGQLISILPVNADGESMPIAQYVTSSGNAQCGANHESATYNGTVNINVPMATVLSGHEADMKKAADSGYYPHGKEGRNKIAYIEYNVTFPEGVTIGNISTSNSASMIDGNRIVKTVNGNVVNFKMYLIDANWATIYGQYLKDKANPSVHTVNISIPYSVVANSKADATTFESENITGNGSFSFYPSGRGAAFGLGLITYNADTANVPFVADLSSCFPTPDPVDVTNETKLKGDILVGDNTEHDKVYETTKNASIDFTGALIVKPIKDQMKQIEQMYNNPDGEKIGITDIDTTFTATIELPDGMTFGKNTPKAVLSGDNGVFKITNTRLDGNKVTVTLKLKDATKLTNYAELAKAINSVDDTLKVTVKGAKFTDNSKPDTNYTVNGTLNGEFNGKATNVGSQKVINFNLKWNAEQSLNGADAIAPSDTSKITFTLKYKNPDPVDVTSKIKLKGDILVGDNTEHDKVYETTKNATIDFTGALIVKPIKDQMKQIEQMYNNPDGEKIGITDMDTTFTATIELPDGMTFGKNTPKAVLSGDNGVFKITNTKLDGNKVTVTLKLKDAAKLTNYAALAKAINSVDDTLKVTVKGARFTDNSKPDTNYTVNGTLNGEFKGKATNLGSQKVINFNLKWNAEQSLDGADAIAPSDTSKITFTLKYKTPGSVEDNQTTENTKPENNTVKTGDTSSLGFYILLTLCGVIYIAGVGIVRRRAN